MKDKEAARMLIALASALSTFLWFRGYWDERIRLNKLSYEVAQALRDWEAASRSAADVAWIYYYRDETEWADNWTQRMVKAVERGGSRLSGAIAVRRRGAIAQQRGDLDEAERLYNEALALFRDIEEGEKVENEALVLNDLGRLASLRKEYIIAEEYYNQALTIAQRIDDKVGQAMYIGNLSNVALACSELKKARSLYTEELALAKAVGRRDLIADAQHGLARILEEEEKFDEALSFAEEALKARLPTRERNLEKTRQLLDRLRLKISDSSSAQESNTILQWVLIIFITFCLFSVSACVLFYLYVLPG